MSIFQLFSHNEKYILPYVLEYLCTQKSVPTFFVGKICDYDSYDCSYDVLEDTFCETSSLATSVQYDIEVVCATLEIVRFLLTSRGLIFDSCLLQMHGDNGTYVPM